MDSITKIDNQIKVAKDKRKELIVEAFAGRTQRYVADKTGLDEFKLSRWINGTATLEESELSTLEKFLGVEFK